MWCLACSVLKYIWNFEIYCGKENGIPPQSPWRMHESEPTIGDARLAHNVVMQLVDGLWDVGHCVTMDNFFSNVGLFTILLSCSIYACNTIKKNWVGLPSFLKNTSAFKNVPQGTTFWKMHDTRIILCVMWKDKKPVLLLSTHSMPIQAPCEKMVVRVLMHNGAVQGLIQTSTILKEYTTYMQRVDVVDQLHASYNCQV